MTASRHLVIGRRFRGPPQSGNGGYTCGMLAAAARTPVEVRLMKPPPLDRPLDIREDAETGHLLLLDGEETVASGQSEDIRYRRARAAFLCGCAGGGAGI